jgi:hypothetical protein
MHEIVEEEYQQFLQDMKEDEPMVFGRYINESEYEDEYSHNDIEDAQAELVEKIRAYLHENCPGKYIVSDGWCVFVMTPERAKESHISERTIQLSIVM